jgi:hypothetical protein
MAEIKSRICDVCGGADATSFTVAKDGLQPWIIDLCEQHGEPLMRLRERGRAPSGGRRPYHRFQKVQVVDHVSVNSPFLPPEGV